MTRMARRASSTVGGPATANASRRARRSRTMTTNHSTSEPSGGSAVSAAPATLWGKTSRSGMGSWGNE